MRRFIRIAAACLLVPLMVQAQGEVSLQYHFNKGDRFEMRRQSTQDSYLQIQGTMQRTTLQLDDTLLLTLSDVNNGTATLSVEYTKIFLLASGNDQQTNVNTQSGGNDIFNQVFKKIINRPFTIVMLPNGDIKSISGLNEILADMQETVSKKDAAEQDAFRQLLEQQFGPDALKAGLQQALPLYPDHNVQTGDSWKNSINTGGALSGHIDYNWKLDYGDKYSVSLSSKGSFSTDKDKVVSLGANMEGNIDLAGEIQGRYAIDPVSGWPSMSVQHTEVNGTYTYKPNEKMKGLQVPVRIVGDTQCKILHL